MKTLQEMNLKELWELFPIILKEYNPLYPVWYEEEREQLAKSLNTYNIFRINHIGSTSVEGLLAKPIIDILLELEGIYEVIEPLQTDGWILMSRDDSARKLVFNKGYTPEGFSEKVFHLHVRPPGDWDELYFRDYLREHADAAEGYGQLKLDLKRKFEHNRDAYTDAKTELIQKYMLKARIEFKNRYFV